MRDNHLTILKALAIILVVMAHAASPLYVSRFSYMIGVSLFFVASGFFFKTKYLNDEATFVKRRIKGLYVPFVKWSIILLVLHNLWFHVGILNETYGNATGGVTHPLSARQWMQSLWSIVTNMSGYDVFIGGAYWFFRALFVSSIVFLLLFKVLSLLPFYHTKRADNPAMTDDAEHFSPFTLIAATISVLALGQAIWMTCCNLRWTGLAQGGYRELMGIFFLSTGYLFNRFYHWLRIHRTKPSLPLPKLTANPDGSPVSAMAKCRHYATVAWVSTKNATCFVHRLPVVPILLPAIILALFTVFSHPSMATRAHNVGEVLALAASGIAGFAFMYNIALVISNLFVISGNKDAATSEGKPIVQRLILYIGENTLYIFGWHLLAFKLASMIKVGVYRLPWEMVGGHPVVHSEVGAWFWVVYTIIGVSVPLLCLYGYRLLKAYCLSIADCTTGMQYIGKVLAITAKFLWRVTKQLCHWTGYAAKVLGHYSVLCLTVSFGWIIRGIKGSIYIIKDSFKYGSDMKHED